MDKLQREFGQKIRLFREKQGLSQDKLAVTAGMHKNYVGAIERGEYNISLKNAAKLAEALGISLAQLADDKKPPSEPTEAEQLQIAISKILKRQRVPKLQSILNVVKEMTNR